MILYQEHNLDEIVRYFGKDFKTRSGQKVLSFEFWVDTHFRKVIFKLYIEETSDQKALRK